MSTRPRTVWGACPKCRKDKVRLLSTTSHEHLAWDLHTYKTWGGLDLHCSASGQHLCDLPARDISWLTGTTPPTCLHD